MRTKKRLLAIAVLKFSVIGLSALWAAVGSGSASGPDTAGRVTLTVLYDNTTAVPGTQSDWGFSCLIRGTEKTVLLDAGGRQDVLFHNLEALKVDPKEV